jgi:hypothetical protein
MDSLFPIRSSSSPDDHPSILVATIHSPPTANIPSPFPRHLLRA